VPVENHTTALRLLTPPKDEQRVAALPVLATPGDLREAVQYLKRKPTGVSVVEALADAKRRVFEPRKVAAYEAWGLVARRGERLLLTRRGREFVRTLEPETRAYRALLYSNPLYRAALAWIYRQGLDLVTYSDVAAYLKEEFGPLLSADGAKAAEEGVVCFFHLCQAAELGTLTIGKRGQPARMRVERDCLGEFVEGQDAPREATRGRAEEGAPAFEEEEFGTTPSETCLFISLGGQPANLVAQIRTVFELAGIKSHASERAPQEGPAALVAEEAGLDDWSFSFQSESPTGEPWLGPDVLDHLDDLHGRGVRDVLVCPIGFVSDHLEIRWDIDTEAVERARELGMGLERIEMPNADPRFVRVLAGLVRRRLPLPSPA
jgi:hypothetical protein